MATLLIIPAISWIGDADEVLGVSGAEEASLQRFKRSRIGYSFDQTDTMSIITPELIMPTQFTGSGLVAIVHAASKIATSSNFVWHVYFEAKTPDADTLDMETANSFGMKSTGTMPVSATAGNPMDLSITITDSDSVAAGDLLRLGLLRSTGDPNDGATGDAIFFSMEIADDG